MQDIKTQWGGKKRGEWERVKGVNVPEFVELVLKPIDVNVNASMHRG